MAFTPPLISPTQIPSSDSFFNASRTFGNTPDVNQQHKCGAQADTSDDEDPRPSHKKK